MHVLIFFVFNWPGQFRGIFGNFAFPTKRKVPSPPMLISVHGINLYFEINFWIIIKSVYPPILRISSAERICGIHGNT